MTSDELEEIEQVTKQWKAKVEKNSASIYWNFDGYLIDLMIGYFEWSLEHAMGYPGHVTAEEWDAMKKAHLTTLKFFVNREETGIWKEYSDWVAAKYDRHESISEALKDTERFPKMDEYTAAEDKAHEDVQEVFRWVSVWLFHLWD